MIRKPQPDRFAMAEEKAAEPEKKAATEKKQLARKKASAKSPKLEAGPPSPPLPEKRPGVRPPNTPYERSGRIYVKCPKALCQALDFAVLDQRVKRDPTPMDKGIAIEEAVRLWLKKHGYKA